MRALMLLLSGLLIVVQVQAADDQVSTYGDWVKKCEKGVEGEAICYILQTANNKKNGEKVMQIQIGYLPQQADPIMSVTVPLGASLPSGAGYFMYNEQLLKMPFLVCGHEGCATSGQKVPDQMIDKMRKGDTGEVRMALLNRQIVSMPVSLKGFTRAFKALQSGK